MATRHLIYGEVGNPRIAGHVIAAALAAISVPMMLMEEFRGAGIFFLGCTGILSISTEIYVATMKRRQRWLEVSDDGCKVIDRHGERELKDFEIVALSYVSTPVLSNGRPAGQQRRCRMWPASGPVIEIQNKLGEGVNDPLGEFIDRVGSLLREGFEQALAEGVEVRGDSWSLGKTMLRCQVGGREEQLPVHKIAAVHPYDQVMGVWLIDKEEPAVSLPIDGRNVWLLPALLAPYLPAQDPEASPPAGGLGRMIFRRKATLSNIIILVGAGLLMIGLGIFGLVTPEELEIGYRIGGAALGLLGIGLICLAIHQATSEFRCQEWGVTHSTMFGRKRLMYRDVASFTYLATRHYTNGAYTGTNISLKFVPRPGCGSPISHNAHIHGDDGELDNLRDAISRIIASQMHVRLATGEEVAWTKNLGFRSEGLVYRPAGFVTRGQPMLLPYENYAGYNLNEGYFFLFEKGKEKPVLSESVGEENFFPGFYLLLNLAHASAEETAE